MKTGKKLVIAFFTLGFMWSMYFSLFRTWYEMLKGELSRQKLVEQTTGLYLTINTMETIYFWITVALISVSIIFICWLFKAEFKELKEKYL